MGASTVHFNVLNPKWYLVPLRGEKNFKPHPQNGIIRGSFPNIFNEQPCPFCMGRAVSDIAKQQTQILNLHSLNIN